MKHYLWLLLLLITPSWAILVQPGYFPIHDDLQAMRQLQMDKCFTDGQVPCRWVPDMGYGFGYPLFNFYPPGPYYLGELFRIINLQFIDIAKLIGIIGFVTSAVSMYLLAKEFWGTNGALISSLLYVFAPYHSVDFYVRAAINEFYALIFLPLIFLFLYKLIQTNKSKYLLFLALSTTGLLLSHNPTLMIFAPFCLVWVIYWLINFKTIQPLAKLALSAFWAVGLAAFFTLPVLFESKFVSLWTLTSGYFNYLAHFTDLKQLFININWGYGASQLGPVDGLSFALGYLHWLIPLIVLLSAFIFRKHRSLILCLVASLLVSLFMSHSKSTFLWKAITQLQYLQFPWRFLTLAIFFASFVSGALVKITKNSLILSCSLTLILLLNGSYFQPRTWYPTMTDAEKFSGDTWRLQRTASIFDYLPIYAPLPPAFPPPADLVFISGQGSFQTLVKKSNLQKFQASTTSPSVIQIQSLYFPGWKLYLDGAQQRIDPKLDSLLGRPQVNLSPGTHTVDYILTNTLIRTISNWLSVITWLGLVILLYQARMIPWTQRPK